MTTTIDLEKLDELRKKLEPKFKKLQSSERVDAIHVVNSLAKHVNKWAHELTGKNFKSVDRDGGTAGTKFVEANGKSYAVVVVDFVYSERGPNPINIDFLGKIIPGVEMKQEHKFSSAVFGEMSFDLTIWPGIMQGLLYDKVYKAYLSNSTELECINEAREQVLAITQYYYPTLTNDDWMRAADLGMLDKWESFKIVLKMHRNNDVNIPELPSDVSSSL